MSRYRFIAAEKVSYPVARLCSVLEVSTSGFYAWERRQPSQRSRHDAMLTEHIRSVHTSSHCTYGAPRIHAELRATGTRVSKKRIARLMRIAGLAGRRPKRFKRTTIPAVTPAAQPLRQSRRSSCGGTVAGVGRPAQPLASGEPRASSRRTCQSPSARRVPAAHHRYSGCWRVRCGCVR